MAVVNLFSKKQKLRRGEVNDFFVYDEFPSPLRVQIVSIIHETVGFNIGTGKTPMEIYEDVHEILRHEYGVPVLIPGFTDYKDSEKVIQRFILTTKDVEKVLDAVELVILYLVNAKKNKTSFFQFTDSNVSIEDAIEELNVRFKEHGVGYQFVNDELIRLDSTYIHSEVVKPALQLLSHVKFKGANEEYLNAHEHYLHGRNKECLVDCLKAFESTIKIICGEKGWEYKKARGIGDLVNILLHKKFLPEYLQGQFVEIEKLMVKGVPTLRNKFGGHGQGENQVIVDDFIARYALNLTGSNIIFLIELTSLK